MYVPTFAALALMSILKFGFVRDVVKIVVSNERLGSCIFKTYVKAGQVGEPYESVHLVIRIEVLVMVDISNSMELMGNEVIVV